MSWGERITYTMQGPGTVESPGATLRSGGMIEGWSASGSNLSGFRAADGVLLEIGTSQLETANLTLEVEGQSATAFLAGDCTQ